MLTVYGAIAVTELTLRAETAQKFLSAGVPAVADPVTFDVGLGKGDPFLRDVQVDFKSADQQSIQTTLSWIDVDTPIPRNEERQSPDPGTRYAPPLRVLYIFQKMPTQRSPRPTHDDSSPTATSTEDGQQRASVSVSPRWVAW